MDRSYVDVTSILRPDSHEAVPFMTRNQDSLLCSIPKPQPKYLVVFLTESQSGE